MFANRLAASMRLEIGGSGDATAMNDETKNDAANRRPDAAVDPDVTQEDVTQDLVTPEFIDTPENLPGDHSDPTSDRGRRSADEVESERSV